MEQKRLLIAIALSFAVFFLWSIFFAPAPPQKPVATTTEKSEIKPPEKAAEEVAPEESVHVIQPQPEQIPADRTARTIKIDTPLYEITLSERGAGITSMVLKNYLENVNDKTSHKELIPDEMSGGTVLLSLNGNGPQIDPYAFYKADQQSDIIKLNDQVATIQFTHTTPSGIQVKKEYTFSPEDYLVGLKVTLYNGSNQAIQNDLQLTLRNEINTKNGRYGFEGPSGLVNNSLKQIKIDDIEEQNGIEGTINWIAIETRYFMTSLILPEVQQGLMVPASSNGLLSNQLVVKGEPLNPQQSRTQNFNIFMGPKSFSLLRSLNNNLDRAINFGWFDFIAKPCLWFMNFIYRFIPNYGVAIIILTIVTRLMFWPLATKSYKSMGEMRKIQPLMQEIREKYKDDKAKMNQEMMALYRTYKINPMGGCLPMLIQMPVFFALYRMLYQAIELRHAPFIWWIQDLSAPDRLLNFDFKIPFMEPPYGIPVLTLIMGASMLLQQKMTPSPGDPTQAKMMMLMPIVFTFIFINFSSGLVLYWLVGNILSMAQQYFTQKKKA